MKVVYSSGNLIVDEVGKIQLSGNIIPEAFNMMILLSNCRTHLYSNRLKHFISIS